MDIYIDKANLVSFVQSREHNLYEDCSKLLKKQLNIYFNFPKDDLRGNTALITWITTLSQGVGENNTINFNSSFPNRPLKSNSTNTFTKEQLSSVYLLEDDDILKLKNVGTVLIGSVGEEIEVLNKLFFLQNDYLFEKKWRINAPNFNCWNNLRGYSLPLTDIIIADQFILKNKDTDTDTLDCNLIQYLDVLSDITNTKVNVVVITNPRNMDYDFEQLKNKIITQLTVQTGKRPYVTLIRTSREHDRTILTNYKRVYSGDTFNFWNNAGNKITNGREISYSSLAKIENYEMGRGLLNDIQETINFLKGNNPAFIEGDKKSNYLDFS